MLKVGLLEALRELRATLLDAWEQGDFGGHLAEWWLVMTGEVAVD